MKKTLVKRNRIKQESKPEQQFVASSVKSPMFEKKGNDLEKLSETKVKKGKVLAIAIAIGTAIIITGCNSPAEKVEKAENDVQKAERALDEANAEYQEDIKNYRKETRARIEANNRSIEKFNERIENGKKEVKAEYKEQIAELEQKNTEMKKRLNEFKADTKEEWLSFKAEFNEDMDDLGMALQNFTTDNK